MALKNPSSFLSNYRFQQLFWKESNFPTAIECFQLNFQLNLSSYLAIQYASSGDSDIGDIVMLVT